MTDSKDSDKSKSKELKHGGARKGAGRKPGSGKYGEKTKTIRVPESRADEIQKLIRRRVTTDEWSSMQTEAMEILTPLYETQKNVDLYSVSVQAGMPTPADDAKDGKLDLNAHLIGDPNSTFYVRVSGESMIDAGINDGDLLIVDRNLPVKNGKIVIAVINGELTVKRIFVEREKVILYPENPNYPAIEVSNDNDFMTLGVVTNVIHQVS